MATMEMDDAIISLAKEKERLEKLWDAYEIQEEEYQEALSKVIVLTESLKEKDKLVDTMKMLLADKDREISDLKLKVAQLEQSKEEMGPKYKALETELKEWKEKYKNLFVLATDLESSLKNAKAHIDARDKWFKTHIGPILNLQPALKERERLIAESNSIIVNSVGNAEDSTSTITEVESTAESTAMTMEPEIDDTGLTKEDLIDVFMMIPSVTRTMAESLVDAGYKDIDDIKEADVQKLKDLNGFNPTLARLVKKDVDMM